MKFIAENPQAAGELLAGHHGPDDHFSNVGAAAAATARATPTTARRSARSSRPARTTCAATDMALANDGVARGHPGASRHTMDGLGDGAKPALATILDDHIQDFEYVATERAEAGIIDAPTDGISGLTYEEGHDYLKALVGDDDTRDGHHDGHRRARGVRHEPGRGDRTTRATPTAPARCRRWA